MKGLGIGIYAQFGVNPLYRAEIVLAWACALKWRWDSKVFLISLGPLRICAQKMRQAT